MRIGINLIPFDAVQGIEIFSKNIVSHLLRLKKDEKFLIFGSENMPELFDFPAAQLIKIKGLNTKYSKAFYQQTLIYPLLKKYKIDLLFSPSPAAPFFYKNKVVVVHDCAYDRFPEAENRFVKTYFRLLFCGAKYFSKKIVTVSNFSKKELIDLYKINPEKIEVIYAGAPELPSVNDVDIESALSKFKINKPYFLYIGNSRPRKNLQGLVRAFKLFKEGGFDYLLVIGGRVDKRFLDLEEEVKKNGLEGRVILTGTLPREDVAALYKEASALTFPSLYEGFGLPVLEAQSLGVPVLTSNVSSLPEVAGNAVLYVDPYSAEEIAKGMEKIALDESFRQDLIKKGFENVKRFSWGKAAERLLNVFHSL